MPFLHSFTSSALGKAIGIGILALLLLIPSAFVQGLISERESRLREVQMEVGTSYGLPQTMLGPVLAVPYTEIVIDVEKNTKQEVTQTAYFLPEVLSIKGTLAPETRSRGIFDAVVYEGEIAFSGSFMPDSASIGLTAENIDFSGARILTEVTDGRGIQKNVLYTLNGAERVAMPERSIFNPHEGLALAAQVPAYTGGKLDFSVGFSYRGSEMLSLAPLGKETEMVLSGSWDKPSFAGKILPVERSVVDGGFEAKWEVSQYGRGMEQAFKKEATNQPNMATIELLSPVDLYAKSERTAKYALLFIGLTFVSFFLFEVLRKLRIHPLQYVLVGFGLALFFLLLLALSEHIGFDAAYMVASVATIALIALYTGSVLRSFGHAGWIAGLLGTLYIYLYLLLLLEEKSLLFGALGLFVILAAVMFLTRNIDWYSTEER